MILGQYFVVPPIFVVKPNTTNSLQVTYRPLQMTRGVPHEVNANGTSVQGLSLNVFVVGNPLFVSPKSGYGKLQINRYSQTAAACKQIY